MRNALDGPTRHHRDPSQAVQGIEEPADRSFDGAGFVSTHAVQKAAGDQGVNVGFGDLKQVAAKSPLPTFAHSLHADGAGATVRHFGKRTAFCELSFFSGIDSKIQRNTVSNIIRFVVIRHCFCCEL